MPALNTKGLWRNYSVVDGLPAIKSNTSPKMAMAICGSAPGTAGSVVMTVPNFAPLLPKTASVVIRSMHCFSTANIGCLDAQGLVWCATWGGISCFDGQHFTNYTVDDGLPHNHIHAVYCDSRDHLWFASEVGVIHYDGHTFQTVRTPHTDSTLSIIEDANDHSMLFSTRNHVVRYRPNSTPQTIRIVQTIANTRGAI